MAVQTQIEHFAEKAIMFNMTENQLKGEIGKKDKELKAAQTALEQMGNQFEQMMNAMSAGK